MKFSQWWAVRIAETKQWGRRGSYFFFWSSSIVLAMAFLLAAKRLGFSTKVDDHIRWLACAFEFFGVTLVIAGVDKSRRSFDRPSIFETATSWIKDARYIFVERKPTSVVFEAEGGSFKLEFSPVRVIAHGSSIEERFVWLKREVLDAHNRIDQSAAELKKMHAEFKADLRDERSVLEDTKQQLSKRLEESFIGDYGVELLGAGYLIVGLILSNLTSEMANICHWVWKSTHRKQFYSLCF